MKAARPALLGLAVGVLAVLLGVLDGGSPTDAQRRSDRWSPSIEDLRLATVVDICGDEVPDQPLIRLKVAADRRRVDCDDPDVRRFYGFSPDQLGDPAFESRDFGSARAWLQQQNARIRTTLFVPQPDDLFQTTTQDANGCSSRGLREIPRQAGSSHPALRADMDGDGRLDRVVAYSLGLSAYGTLQTHLRVELATGTTIDDVTTRKTFNFVQHIYGSTDLDGNGRSEVWIEPNTNKPGAVSILLFQKCAIVDVEDESGLFLVQRGGGSIADSDAVWCTKDRVVRAQWTRRFVDPYGPGSEDSEESWWFEVLQLRGRKLVVVDHGSGENLADQPPPVLWSSTLRCV